MEGALAPWHLILLLVAFIVLFGAKRLPDAARSLGQSMRIFKAETRGLHADAPPAPDSSPGHADPDRRDTSA